MELSTDAVACVGLCVIGPLSNAYSPQHAHQDSLSLARYEVTVRMQQALVLIRRVRSTEGRRPTDRIVEDDKVICMES